VLQALDKKKLKKKLKEISFYNDCIVSHSIGYSLDLFQRKTVIADPPLMTPLLLVYSYLTVQTKLGKNSLCLKPLYNYRPKEICQLNFKISKIKIDIYEFDRYFVVVSFLFY